MSDTNEICALCGNPATVDDEITREHCPPKQFYPKSIRSELNLWTDVPTHKTCNAKNKLDEEYFFHVTYLLVANANPEMAKVLLEELRRRGKNPQTPALLRSIFRTKRRTTPGGLVLPPDMISLDLDTYRVQQVVIKIARCLFYRDQKIYMPYENCQDIHLCEREKDLPELYRLATALTKVNIHDATPLPSGILVVPSEEAGGPKAVSEKIFSYRVYKFERHYFYTLVFWDAFAFCLAFIDPLVAVNDEIPMIAEGQNHPRSYSYQDHADI